MTAKLHRVHVSGVGEAFVFQGGGTPYKVDAVAIPDLIGAYARFGRKGFVYARAGAAIVPDMGAKQSLNQKIGNSAIQAAYAAGATTITITSAVSCTENELAGGEVVVFPAAGNQAFNRGIVSNPAMTATATLTIVLDAPIPVAITTGASAEIIKNPYSAVNQVSNEWMPVMGMPVMPATTGEGVWLQVEGLSWCAPAAEVGAAVNCIDVCFGGDGALRTRRNANHGEQRAGMIVATSVAGGAQGAPFIILNIDH